MTGAASGDAPWTGKYARHRGRAESNVYQITVDYPDGRANGHHIMLDSAELVTVRWV